MCFLLIYFLNLSVFITCLFIFLFGLLIIFLIVSFLDVGVLSFGLVFLDFDYLGFGCCVSLDFLFLVEDLVESFFF